MSNNVPPQQQPPPSPLYSQVEEVQQEGQHLYQIVEDQNTINDRNRSLAAEMRGRAEGTNQRK